MTSLALMAFRLAEYVRSLSHFEIWESQAVDHVGEAVANAVLQSGVNFQTVVAPRLVRIRVLYPDALTVRAFQLILKRDGAHEVLQWRHDEKPRRLEALTQFFCDEGLETVADIGAWLDAPLNRQRIRSIRGMGPKTVDYLGGLTGLPVVAVDRHVRSFAAKAGLDCTSYDELKAVVEYAADMLGIRRNSLDHSIWRHEAKVSRLRLVS